MNMRGGDPCRREPVAQSSGASTIYRRHLRHRVHNPCPTVLFPPHMHRLSPDIPTPRHASCFPVRARQRRRRICTYGQSTTPERDPVCHAASTPRNSVCHTLPTRSMPVRPAPRTASTWRFYYAEIDRIEKSTLPPPTWSRSRFRMARTGHPPLFIFCRKSARKADLHEGFPLIQLHPKHLPQKPHCTILQLARTILQLARTILQLRHALTPPNHRRNSTAQPASQ